MNNIIEEKDNNYIMINGKLEKIEKGISESEDIFIKRINFITFASSLENEGINENINEDINYISLSYAYANVLQFGCKYKADIECIINKILKDVDYLSLDEERKKIK